MPVGLTSLFLSSLHFIGEFHSGLDGLLHSFISMYPHQEGSCITALQVCYNWSTVNHPACELANTYRTISAFLLVLTVVSALQRGIHQPARSLTHR